MSRMWMIMTMMMVDVVVSLTEAMAWQCPSVDSPSGSLLVRFSTSTFVVVAFLFVTHEIRSHGSEVLDQGEAAPYSMTNGTSGFDHTAPYLLS